LIACGSELRWFLMSSLRLSTQLQQKMVLTPQLRQRIEMLQMTSMELNELIDQEMVANPLLEEVQSGDEEQEISGNILDQNSDGIDEVFPNGHNEEAGSAFSASDADFSEPFSATLPSENGSEPEGHLDDAPEPLADSGDSFEEIDFGKLYPKETSLRATHEFSNTENSLIPEDHWVRSS